jgi:hypothetical protein
LKISQNGVINLRSHFGSSLSPFLLKTAPIAGASWPPL